MIHMNRGYWVYQILFFIHWDSMIENEAFKKYWCQFRFCQPSLTPKGLNVCMADKPVLGSATWSHTIFRFLKLFMKIHLAVSFAWVQIS
jgi:hypothetical protein